MKKSMMVVTMMGAVGGILFALGMCGVLVPALSMFGAGIALGILGILVLLAMWPVYCKMEHIKPIRFTRPSRQVVITAILGTVSLIGLGVGLAMCLGAGAPLLVPGIIIGCIGILVGVGSIFVAVGVRE